MNLAFYFIASFRPSGDWLQPSKQESQMKAWMRAYANRTKTCPVAWLGREQLDFNNPHYHGIILHSDREMEMTAAGIPERELMNLWYQHTSARIIKLEPYKPGFDTISYVLDKHDPLYERFCCGHYFCRRHGCWNKQVDIFNRQQFEF